MIEESQQEAPVEAGFTDPVADRLHAMAEFVKSLDIVKNEDILREGLKIMDVVRRSIRTLPQADLIAMKGGKSEQGN